MTTKLLDVENLTVEFRTDNGSVTAVDSVSFAINKGETVGLVGESGAGKSVTALSIPRLVPSPPSRVKKGSIFFNGQNLLDLDIRLLRKIRGKSIGIIFQDPSTALSPLHRVGRQMVEAVRMHQKISKKEAWQLAEDWLVKVKIPDPAERMLAYPYELSGGMQQRIMIAMALIQEPELIIADEPTTALDVTIQAQVFELIKEMKKKEASMLLITHDMGVVWEMCDRVIVMYASEIVEEGGLDNIFTHPAHPYTKGLLESIPGSGKGRGETLPSIPGQVPSPSDYPAGCHFEERCSVSLDRCKYEKPDMAKVSDGHRSACWLICGDGHNA